MRMMTAGILLLASCGFDSPHELGESKPNLPRPAPPVPRFNSDPHPPPTPKAPVTAEPKEAPPAPKPQDPPKEAKKPDPSRRLPVEEVDFSAKDPKTHSVIAYAADKDRARVALEAHRTHSKELIDELPEPVARSGAGLYLIWGDYPESVIKVPVVHAKYDAGSKKIIVTVPSFHTRSSKDDGIGMDWGVDKSKKRVFIGFRVDLDSLAPGDYDFEVIEKAGQDEKSRVLKTGSFMLRPQR